MFEPGTDCRNEGSLVFAEINYRRHEAAILAEFEQLKGGRREGPLHEIAMARCGFYQGNALEF